MENYAYVNNKPFGKGTYGEVFLLKHRPSGKEMVMKRIPGNTDVTLIENEIKAGKILQEHPGIPKFQESFTLNLNTTSSTLIQTQNGNNLFYCLIFEYVPRSVDLYTWMQRRNFYPTNEAHAISILKQLVHILNYIHSKGVVHRDLKLENIMIDSKGKNIFLLDFGLCGFFQKPQPNEKIEKFHQQFNFSNEYTAPEVYQRKTFDGIQADIYSAGIIFYSLLFGEFPFSEKKRLLAQKQNLCHPVIEFRGPLPVSSNVKRLISKMLNPLPEERIDLNGISTILDSLEQSQSKPQ